MNGLFTLGLGAASKVIYYPEVLFFEEFLFFELLLLLECFP